MSSQQENQPSRPVARAREWVDGHTDTTGGRPKGLEDAGPVPSVDDLRRQQHREMRGFGMGTRGQFRGALAGSLTGATVGFLLGALIGWFALDSLATVPRILIPGIVGAVAVSTIGFVYLGSREPELENETLTATGAPQDGTTQRDPGTDERGR